MLGNKERDAAIANTLFVLCHHIVAHNLDVTAIAAIQELAYDVGLRVKRNAVVNVGVGREELLEYAIVILVVFVERQINLGNLYLWEVVYHIMTETCFAVGLLF